MSLQRNALLLVLATGLLGILGPWDPPLAHLWCLPAAVLLGNPRCVLVVVGPERALVGGWT